MMKEGGKEEGVRKRKRLAVEQRKQKPLLALTN
jgi:hypothetical protein